MKGAQVDAVSTDHRAGEPPVVQVVAGHDLELGLRPEHEGHSRLVGYVEAAAGVNR